MIIFSPHPVFCPFSHPLYFMRVRSLLLKNIAGTLALCMVTLKNKVKLLTFLIFIFKKYNITFKKDRNYPVPLKLMRRQGLI